MTKVGFVLLTHSHPEQVLALTQALSVLYDTPPIVCHHDFGQCALDKKLFSSNVRFVEPHFPTFWGCFSIVPAALAGIRLLMDGTNPPDWFYLLSGSDYPAMSPDRVLETLARTNYDAFIDHREIKVSNRKSKNVADHQSGFARPSYLPLAYRRYCALAIPRPSLKKPLAIPPVGRFYAHHPWWRSILPGPFSSSFRCYAGEHWFSANAKAAACLLNETEQSRRLFAHLTRRESPEECYYHSILANSPLRLNSDNLRYIDWPSPDSWHPATLTVSDLPAIVRSEAHFARKVKYGSALVAELDRMLGISSQRIAKVG
ncbi:MAG TPA: beta-1,6-N-acetylglucosaminyltransferase [Terracidiphilus sp.]|jgi:hypothetical protein